MSTGNSDHVLEVRHITKVFPGTKALDDVSIALDAGTVHAIVGENGAGKSTLMNIIAGVYQPTEGEVLINGDTVKIENPHVAQSLGIGFVHQEIALCQHLSVAENIFMSTINARNERLIDFRKYNREAKKLLSAFHVDIDPAQRVGSLSVSEQQVVEIAKSLSLNCRIVIFDEPTAALTESESEALFKIIADLKSQGIGVLYISHRMAEIFGNCDVVSVLRDGMLIETTPLQETNEDRLVRSMVGRELSKLYPPKATEEEIEDSVLLSVEKLSSDGDFQDVSFELRKGEILGLSGLIGAGRSELAKTICGLQPRTGGTVRLFGEDVTFESYRDAIEHGVVYLTEDRKSEGLFLRMNIKRNISAIDLGQVSSNAIIDGESERKLAKEYVDMLNVRCSSLEQKLNFLSGGNQQKVLLGKLLSVKPKIVFMDEPTRGIDVGAKTEIHRLLRSLSKEGVGVVVISSELPEVIGMCDRVLVMHEGSSKGVVVGDDINEEEIIRRASGL